MIHHWVYRHPTNLYGVLSIAAGGEVNQYFVQILTVNVVLLKKLKPRDVREYTVYLGETPGPSCGCDSFCRTSRPCKHIRALTELREGGDL